MAQQSPQESRTKKPKMMWTNGHDLILAREILAEDPFRFKIGTRERGQCWDKVANILNGIEQPCFWVDQRAVRDRFQKLAKTFKRRMEGEKQMNGGNTPELCELDLIIQDIVEKSDEIRNGLNRWESFIEGDNDVTESPRKRFVEGLVEMKRKRNLEVEQIITDNSDSENGEWKLKMGELELRKKEIEMAKEEKDREWELKRREIEIKEKECEARINIDTNMVKMLQEQFSKQNDLQHQLQQQNQILLDFIKKLLDKFP